MATHKVPQDVEAEDKLVAFLSLKQFIFTIVGLGFGYLTFLFFTRVHPLAAIIWLPFVVVFLVLGLYQRKDQPAEVYLASAIRYFLKPRKRKWSLEGYQERVIITAPPKIEHNYTKGFTGEEATSRLGNLSRLMDSRGWASKLANDWQNPQLATAAASDRLVQPGQLAGQGVDPQKYMQPADVMDENSSIVSRDFQARIAQTDNTARQHALQALQQARATAEDDGSADNSPGATVEQATVAPKYQKYPDMHQKVVSTATNETAQNTDKNVVEPQTAADFVKERPVDLPTKPEPEQADDGSVEIKLH